MINITSTTEKLFDVQAQGYAFFIEENNGKDRIQEIAQQFFPQLEQLIKEQQFAGKQSSAFVLPVIYKDKLIHLILVGLGKKDKKKSLYDIEYFRRAVGKIIRCAESHNISSVVCTPPLATLFDVTNEYLLQQMAIAAYMAGYHFDDFKKDRLSEKKLDFIVSMSPQAHKNSEQTLKISDIISQAVNRTRHWIDTPPSRLNPTILAQHAQDVAQKTGLKCTVFDEPEIIKMGMGGLAAVAAGSEQDAKFIILEYNCGNKSAPTIAFVGKGITFDSGGLSLKPSQSMVTMKEDMAGAAAVINAIGACAQLKAPVNIVALAPTTENLPSGTATKPGDIIRFYNGKTAEVLDTDAEGRLILADALSYAVKHFKPSFIIDLATLTGAADYVAGPFYSVVLTQDEDMATKVVDAAQQSGERVWRLPMHDDYATAVTSDVADLRNIGKPIFKAGTITASFFLKHFVDEIPWVHVDIASNAFDVPNVCYYESGGTGSGVRLLIELALNWK